MNFCDLEALVENHEYVTFDFFDTLVYRPFWKPYDLFFLVGLYAHENMHIAIKPTEFVFLRRKAEKQARLAVQTSKTQDVSLNEIYKCLQKNLKTDDGQRDELQQQEEKLEYEYCYKRTSIASLYNHAIQTGKKTAVISDMYLSESVIRGILVKNKMLLPEDFFVSSEYRKTKACGELFVSFLEANHISDKKSVFHIGDNIHSDYLVPQHLGIDACHIPNPVEQYAEMSGGNSLHLLTRCRQAVVANELWDNPFSENKDSLRDTLEAHFGSYQQSELDAACYTKRQFMGYEMYDYAARLYQKLRYATERRQYL